MATAKDPIADAIAAAAAKLQAGGTSTGGGPIYLGVPSGSDWEAQGLSTSPLARKYKVFGSNIVRAPRYKVGYQNSKTFRRELGGMDPDVIFFYQQRMEASGLLDKYTPGQLDKATRAAFKELLSTANQSGDTWQKTLQDIEAVGGLVGDSSSRQQPDAFVAQLDDPVTLREAFQKVAQSIYGGDLPDGEVQAMVDAYRSQQLSKQQAAYDAQLAASDGGTPGQVDTETDPQAYVMDELKRTHPQQLNRVKFSDSLSTVLATFGSGGH